MNSQNQTTLKRKQPSTTTAAATASTTTTQQTIMAPLTTDSDSVLVIPAGNDSPLQKRIREDAPSTAATTTLAASSITTPQQSEAPVLKKRRVSMPVVHISGKANTDTMARSKSCNALKSGGVSPVQLLRTFQLERKEKNQFNGASFVKPNDKNLASYEVATVSAVRSSNLASLRSLREEGKSLDACNQFGESLLHMACRRGNPDVVRFMVEEAKCNVNVRDDYGRTILHDATWTSNPNFDVMEILLKAIQPEMLLAEDVRGHTPFDYARKEHWPEWVTFLTERKSTIEPNEPTLRVIA